MALKKSRMFALSTQFTSLPQDSGRKHPRFHRMPRQKKLSRPGLGGRVRVLRAADGARAAERELKAALQHRRHQPLPEQGRWLGPVLRGYFAYHAVPTNIPTASSHPHGTTR